MSRRQWSALFQSIVGSLAAKSRKTVSKPNLALEKMEDRTTPAAFVYDGTSSLSIDLDNANESITLTSQGGGNYAFTSTSNFTGTDSTGLTGNGTTSLTITNALALSSISITDSATGTSVVFDTSTGSYVDNLSIALNNAGAGGVSVNQATAFAGAAMSVLSAEFVQVSAPLASDDSISLSAASHINAAANITGGATGVSLTANSGGTATGDTDGVRISNNAVISTTSNGSITITGKGGSGNGNQNNGVDVSTGSSISANGSGTVSITGTGGSGTGNSNWGLRLSGQIASGSGTISLAGTYGDLGTSQTNSNGIVIFSTSGVSSTSGSVNITATGATTAASQAFFLDASIVVGAGQSVTVTADSVWIFTSGSINATSTGTVAFATRSAGTQIDLGGSDVLSGSLVLGLEDAELDSVTAGTIIIGTVTSGAATVSSAVSIGNNTNLQLTAAGISQSASLSVAGSTTLNAGTNAITLTQAGNDFTGAVTATGAATQITDTNALTVSLTTSGSTVLSAGGNLVASGTVTGAASGLTTTTTGTGTTSFGATTVGQNLSVTSVGAVSQTGALSVTGTTNISAAGQAITLTQAGNDFTAAVTATGAATQITDTNALTVSLTTSGSTVLSAGGNLVVSGTVTGAASGLTTTTTGTGTTTFGATTVGQNLSVTSVGAVSQTGALSVTGTAQISAAGQAITLTQAGNDFTGAVTATGAATQITDANALTVALTTSGSTVLSAGGNLVASGTVTGAASGLTTTTTGTGTTSFGATTVGQNLSVTSVGAVSQTGALSVTGTTNISAAGQAITLTQAGNDFTGAVTATGAATQITDTNALTVSLTTSGSTVLSAGGNLVASGSVNGATSDLTTTTTGTGTTSLGATTVGRNLSVTSVGAVSQTGALSVTGTATFAAGTSSITLNTATNAFSTVTVTSGGNVSLAETGGFTIGGIAGIGAGNIGIKSSGPVAASGAITTTGTITLNGLATNSSIGIAGGAGDVQYASSVFTNLTDGASQIVVGSLTQTGMVTVGGTVSFSDPAVICSPGAGGSVTVGGAITGTGNASVTLSASPTTIFLNADITTAGQPIVIDNGSGGATSVVLGANVTLSSGAGAINVNGTVDGAFSLTLNSTGTTTLGGAVGGGTALTSITTDAGGTLAINGGSVKTAGNQTYNDAVTLGADTTLTGVAITLVSTVDGAQSLTINASGLTTLGGAVGSVATLSSITTDAPGSLALNGGSVKTSGNQLFNDGAVTVGTLLALVATGSGNITFSGSVDALGNTLEFDAAGTLLGEGDVTAFNAMNDFATVKVTQSNNAKIADVNDIDLGDCLTFRNLIIQSDGNVSDSGQLDVGGTLEITATGGNSILDSNSGAAFFAFTGIIEGVTEGIIGSIYIENLSQISPRDVNIRQTKLSSNCIINTSIDSATSIRNGSNKPNVNRVLYLSSVSANTLANKMAGSFNNSTFTLSAKAANNNSFKNGSFATIIYGTNPTQAVSGITSGSVSIINNTDNTKRATFNAPEFKNDNSTKVPTTDKGMYVPNTSDGITVKFSPTRSSRIAGLPGIGKSIDTPFQFTVFGDNVLFNGRNVSDSKTIITSANAFFVSIDGDNEFSKLTTNGLEIRRGGLRVSLDRGYDPQLTKTFVIVNNTSNTAVVGEFAGLPERSIIKTGTQAFTITYKGGDGNDVVLIACNDVPDATGAIVSRPFADAVATGNVISTIGNAVQFTSPEGASRQMLPFLNTGYKGNISASGIDRTGDGITDAIVAGVASPKNPTTLRVIDAASGRIAYTLTPFGPNFRGGMRVSAGIANVGGEIKSVIAVGAGPGSNSRVKVFDAVDGQPLKSFVAFSPRYRGGVTVSISTENINNPATPGYLVVSSLVNPTINVYDLKSSNNIVNRLVSFPLITKKNGDPVRGVNPSIQIGDIDGDRITLEIVVGACSGGSGVSVFNTSGEFLAGIKPFPPAYRGGIRVGLDDVNKDGTLDVVLAAGYSPSSGTSGIASAAYKFESKLNMKTNEIDYMFSTIKGAGDNFFSLFTQGEATADFFLGINPAVNRLPGSPG